uniref:Uncharacterized protein n=1 Tax=Arundo donax TaxID=35708 RepID=A0A0A9C8R3_ARUDO
MGSAGRVMPRSIGRSTGGQDYEPKTSDDSVSDPTNFEASASRKERTYI